jgi:hypothetical protein
LVFTGCNPARAMERHKVKNQDVRFLRLAELRKILAAAPAKPLGEILIGHSP